MKRFLKFVLTVAPLALIGTAVYSSLPGVKRYAEIRKNTRSKEQRPTKRRP